MLEYVSLPTIVSFLGQFLATKLLDGALSQKENSVEFQMIKALDEALERLCCEAGWEYDNTAILETFILSLGELEIHTDKHQLKLILDNAIGGEVSMEHFKAWETYLRASIACKLELSNFILMTISSDTNNTVRDLHAEITLANSPASQSLIPADNSLTLEYFDQRMKELTTSIEYPVSAGLSKENFKNFRKCKEFLCQIVGGRLRDNNETTSEADEVLLPLLRTFIGEGTIEEFYMPKFVTILESVHKKTPNVLCAVKLRWEAIVKIFEDDKAGCDDLLETILVKYEKVPPWFKANILIDIRNQIDFQEGRDKFFDVQEKIMKSPEGVHFPILDRYNSSAYFAFLEKPTQRGVDATGVVEGIFGAFLAAAYYGSITHMRQINSTIKRILYLMNKEYMNGDIFQKYLQACIHWDESHDVKILADEFKVHFSLLSHDAAKTIWESIKRLSSSDKQLHLKLTIIRFIGDYMDDSTFEAAKNDIFSSLKKQQKLKLANMSLSVRSFIKATAFRLDVNEVIGIMFSYPKNFINDFITFNTLQNINFFGLSDEAFSKIIDFIYDVRNTWGNDKTNAIENFTLTIRGSIAEKHFERLDCAVKSTFPEFYEQLYSCYAKKDVAAAKLSIPVFLDEISKTVQKREDEKCEIVSSSGDCVPLQIIYSILTTHKNFLSSEEITKITEQAIRVLLTTRYNSDAKIWALELILLLWAKYEDEAICTVISYQDEIVSKSLHDGFYPNSSISPFVNFLENAVSENLDAINFTIELSYIKTLDKSTQVKFRAFVDRACSFLNFTKINNKFTVLLFQFIVDGINSENHDIRHFSVRAMAKIGRNKQSLSSNALSCLHDVYVNHESAENKTHILDGMYKIDSEDALTLELLERAKIDSNYHVSKVARDLLG